MSSMTGFPAFLRVSFCSQEGSLSVTAKSHAVWWMIFGILALTFKFWYHYVLDFPDGSVVMQEMQEA